MVTLKTSPVGIDVPIQAVLSELNAYILEEYGIDDDKYKCYGRAYRNQQALPADGYVPEVFAGGNSNDYKEVLVDDLTPVTSFFSTPERIVINAQSGKMSASIPLIFCVNLAEIFPGANRNDEEARMTVLKFFNETMNGFTVNEVITGIANVYSEYTGFRNKSEMKFRDMHPWHHFRLNLNLNYDFNCLTNLFPN